MLVLSRKANECVVIGGLVKVYIVSVKGNSVRLGFEGPKEVEVLRGEIHLKREEGNGQNENSSS